MRTPLDQKPLQNLGESVQQERSRLMEEEFAPAAVLVLCAVLVTAWEWVAWYFDWPPQPVAV